MSTSSRATPIHAEPPGPPGIFGLRNLYRFGTGSLALLRDLQDRYGDVVRMKLLGKPWYFVSHPDDIEALFIEHAKIMGRDAYIVVLQRVLGMGLLTSDGDLWKRQRKLMSQAFTPRRITEYATAMSRVTAAGLAPWRDGAVLNLHQEMSRITMEVVADVLFGASVSAANVQMVGEALEVVNDYLASSPEAVLMLPKWVPTPRNVRVNRAVAQLDRLVYDIVAKRRRGERREDLLGTLLAAQDDDGSRMSDQQLRDEAITLFLAGHETTALTLAHTFYLLAGHPEIERKLHAEIDALLGDRLPTAADARALPYTERVLKESMRLYPPAWTTGREATESFELGGYTIPKGAQLLMSQWVLHRDARWFPNPEGFDPDRWLPEKAKDIPRYAYIPFGGGPRVCIGSHFAMMEATLILAIILQRHRIELLPGQTLELAPAVTLRQKGPGLQVRITARRSSPMPIEPAGPLRASIAAE